MLALHNITSSVVQDGAYSLWGLLSILLYCTICKVVGKTVRACVTAFRRAGSLPNEGHTHNVGEVERPSGVAV